MENLIKFVSGYSPEFIENGTDGDFMYIDIAVEFSLNLFIAAGITTIEVDKNGYISNELGTFYFNGNVCWMWAVTNKSTRSRNFKHVGKFYLTDSESGTKIPTNKKIWANFKKEITPKLDEALQKFAEENCLDEHVSKEFREAENYINDQCY